MLSPLVMVGLFFIAMLAGFIDALAGGGGLINPGVAGNGNVASTGVSHQ